MTSNPTGGIMVRRIILLAGLVVMVSVAACGDDDADTTTLAPVTIQAATTATEAVQALQPGPVASFEDIAGIYEDQGPGPLFFMYFFEDGTMHGSSNPDLIVDRPQVVFETRFEGTEILITTTRLACDQPHQGGTYEIHLLESGNLQFVAVDEDPCPLNSGELLSGEYAPVP